MCAAPRLSDARTDRAPSAMHCILFDRDDTLVDSETLGTCAVHDRLPRLDALIASRGT